MLSALTAIFQEFKENCNVTHSIITYSRKKDEFYAFMLYRKTLKLKMKKINYEHCVINMVSVMKIIGAIIK